MRNLVIWLGLVNLSHAEGEVRGEVGRVCSSSPLTPTPHKTPPTTTPWPDQIPYAIGFLLPTSRSVQTLVMVHSCGTDVDSSYIDYKSTNTDLTSENAILDDKLLRFGPRCSLPVHTS